MNLMKREHFGALREAVHAANPAMILGSVIVACRYGQSVDVMRYINDASRVAPYNNISTWGNDPAVVEMCDYINNVNMSRQPEDLGNLAYLIMSSEWCDEWLAFAVDVLGHIDVGTVNLGDALHWWCGHWRVLHQRILDAGWRCEPRHVWDALSYFWFDSFRGGVSESPPITMSAGNFMMFLSYENTDYPEFAIYHSRHPHDQPSLNNWYMGVRTTDRLGDGAAWCDGVVWDVDGWGPSSSHAQKLRGHE